MYAAPLIYVVKYLCSYILQLLINFNLYVNEKKLLFYLLIWSFCKCISKFLHIILFTFFPLLISFLHLMKFELLYV